MFDRIAGNFLVSGKNETWCSGFEQTIDREVLLSGVGLHSGIDISMMMRPAAAGTGIVFRRLDLVDGLDVRSGDLSLSRQTHPSRNIHSRNAGQAIGKTRPLSHALQKDVSIRAHPHHVFTTELGTTLANGSGATVSTVEHLMASLAAFGITNVFVDLDGPEIPIMDGSSELFCDAIETAGVRQLAATQRALKITREVELGGHDRWVRIAPSFGLGLDILVEVDFDDTAIGCQQVGFNVSKNVFRRNVAHARTFCSMKDVETMRSNGLALGGSMDNAIVVNEGKIMNEGGLRCNNEFAMHKALDLLGDLFLIGMPVFGVVHASKPGHDLNTRLAKAILDSDAFEIIDVPASSQTSPAIPDLISHQALRAR